MATYYEPGGPRGKGGKKPSLGVTGLPDNDSGQSMTTPTFQMAPEPMLGAERQWYDAAAYGAPMHFGTQNSAASRINDVMSGAAQQWSDAAQKSADRSQQMALSNNAMQTALQMKKMEVDRDREKYGLLSGLLGGPRVFGGPARR